MRSLGRPRRREEEEESVFVSVTDLTVSFLFILMILMAFFAARYNPDEVVSVEAFQAVKAERDEARREIDDLARLLAEERRRTSDLERAMTLQEVRLQDLRSELRTSQDDEAATMRLAERLRAERDVLAEEVAFARDLDVEVARLTDLVARQRIEIEEALRDLDEARRTIVDRDEELDALRVRVSALEERVKARDERILVLEEEVAALRTRLSQAQAVDPLERYLQAVSISRQIALQRLRDAIEARFPDLNPQISDDGALRFQGEGLFASGSSVLRGRRRLVVEGIAEVLDEVLACYALGPRARFDEACNPGHALVEALQIEGHTDSRGSDLSNMRLSTDRAVETFAVMTGRRPTLFDHLNRDGETVLAVSGYGERRPVAPGDAPEALSQNRRIDLRFIMFTPERAEEIEPIRARLREVLR